MMLTDRWTNGTNVAECSLRKNPDQLCLKHSEALKRFNSLGNELKMTQDEKCKVLMVKSQTRNTAALFYSSNQWNAYVDKNPSYSSLKIIKSNIWFQHGCYQQKRGEFNTGSLVGGKWKYVFEDGFTWCRSKKFKVTSLFPITYVWILFLLLLSTFKLY